MLICVNNKNIWYSIIYVSWEPQRVKLVYWKNCPPPFIEFICHKGYSTPPPIKWSSFLKFSHPFSSISTYSSTALTIHSCPFQFPDKSTFLNALLLLPSRESDALSQLDYPSFFPYLLSIILRMKLFSITSHTINLGFPSSSLSYPIPQC